ncbi:MAG: hypothetical protein IJ192_01460 [Clostridia bacterium]|nr:hypothetical protein [Clostridia bacterium]
MKTIQDCAKLYDTLIGNEYTLILENDMRIVFNFDKGNFFHLIGLHKLSDVNEFYIGNRRKSKNRIYKELLSGIIDDNRLRYKKGYDKIIIRVENFEYITDLLCFDKSNKLIIDFDINLINRFDSLLSGTKYILYKQLNNVYIHLTFGQGRKIYPESFFVHNGKDYISEQTLIEIKDIQIKQHIVKI